MVGPEGGRHQPGQPDSLQQAGPGPAALDEPADGGPGAAAPTRPAHARLTHGTGRRVRDGYVMARGGGLKGSLGWFGMGGGAVNNVKRGINVRFNRWVIALEDPTRRDRSNKCTAFKYKFSSPDTLGQKLIYKN